MWLTTSKNAPATIKKQARAFADALPGAEFIPRGERSLERLEVLAGRKGEKTLVVLMACDEDKKNLFVIRSRHLKEDADGALHWAWSEKQMIAKKIRIGEERIRERLGEDPFVYSPVGDAKAICSFLGLEDHPLAEYTDEPAELKLEVKKPQTKSRKKTSAHSVLEIKFGKEQLLGLEYLWVE